MSCSTVESLCKKIDKRQCWQNCKDEKLSPSKIASVDSISMASSNMVGAKGENKKRIQKKTTSTGPIPSSLTKKEIM